jgi:hypothetical protein
MKSRLCSAKEKILDPAGNQPTIPSLAGLKPSINTISAVETTEQVNVLYCRGLKVAGIL